MVGTLTRFHKLRKLLNIKFGPGAAVLPQTVTRLHLEFSLKADGGHMGPRHFWKEMLPRLKYHNPAIPITVSRRRTTDGPALMTVYLRQPTAPPDLILPPITPSGVSATGIPAPAPTKNEQAVTIDMKNLHCESILAKFLSTTKAVLVEPTEEEKKEMQEVKVMEAQGEIDQRRVKKMVEKEKQERDMLERARKDLTGI